MGNKPNKAFKTISCFLLFLVLFAINTLSTISATEHPDLESQLEDYLSEHEEDIAGLATIVIDQGEVIYKMKGYSNIAEQTLVDEDTVFEWASLSKMLIWVSVLQLAEAGKLELDTDIETYLPSDFRSKTNFEEPVTLQHLMHHAAGFDDSYTDLMLHQPTKKSSLREALEAADINQVFPPGDVVAYSNYSSGLAAFIVEEVSGLDYREYVRTNIFEPLQMTKTAIDPDQEDNSWVKEQREAGQGYSPTRQVIEPNLYTMPLYPVGIAMGTATDMQKFMQALLTEDGAPLFKDEKTIDFMFEPTLYYPGTNIPRVANGLFYLPSKSKHVFGHGGNSKAFSAAIYVDREAGTGVLVLTNVKNEYTFTAGIPEIVFGKYVHAGKGEKMENSSQWTGIYETARLPRHGFSRVHGLFLRGKTKQNEAHDIMINDLHYSQLEPSVYQTKDDFSVYSLDVYSNQPQTKKMLSNAYSDLLYVPYARHLLEWGGMILGLLAVIFSLIYVIASIFRRKRHKLLFAQHFLNLLMVANVIWIVYQALSMVSYASLKPFLILNLIYIVISLISSGLLLAKIKSKKVPALILTMTILSAVVLCANVLYWEFYF